MVTNDRGKAEPFSWAGPRLISFSGAPGRTRTSDTRFRSPCASVQMVLSGTVS